jgi:hypothetical protein
MSLILLLILWYYSTFISSEITSGRIKGSDEPQLVSWKVLEGITEPFGTSHENAVPVWKQMKSSADQKAANMAMQQALHEYGQILRHPYVFGDMPSGERYDVFLSMAKLLKAMGFHQRAELMLHEAMTHTVNAYEANFQLGLLFLDKEDLITAKIHFKNCLFYQDSDLLILSYLNVILLTEGKINESVYFLSRILSQLEERIRKLSFIISEQEIAAMSKQRIDYKLLANWLEDTIVKVFYGEFRFTPLASIELFKYFSNLYAWIQSGEMNGRFLFDLGQSLYENGGRSKIGLVMMQKGIETSSIESEGLVSYEVIRLRLAFEVPIIHENLLEIIEYYLNITTFLSVSSKNYTKIDIENTMDMYWPIPLLGWTGLPVMPVMRELLWRFEKNGRNDEYSLNSWLRGGEVVEFVFEKFQEKKKNEKEEKLHAIRAKQSPTSTDPEKNVIDFDDLFDNYKEEDGEEEVSEGKDKKNSKINTFVIPPKNSIPLKEMKIEIGIFAGHMNNHPVGQMTLHYLISQLKDDSNPLKSSISITLLSLPLFPDTVTKKIASKVDKIINIPMDILNQAIPLLENTKLDIILFPDWSPFPDQQALVFQSMRLAPVQICYYVRGTSCASNQIDYYLLPAEIEDYYLNAVPAAASNAIKRMNISSPSGRSPGSSGGVNTTNPIQKMIGKHLRPSWRELFSEQVILVDDWPLLTAQSIENSISLIQAENAVMSNRKMIPTAPATSPTPISSPSVSSGSSSAANPEFAIMEDYFSPNEYEGKIFFKDQPVAILPVYPTYIHPLMDEMIFKIMRSIPVLQVLLVIPDSFLTHVRDSRHKLNWCKKLVRRLWEKSSHYDGGGPSVAHRIRLLPSTLSDYRLLQLIRQTDLVLDTFPTGSSAYFLGLALSVGTPVITLRTGTLLTTPREEMNEIKQFLHHSFSNGLYKDHPLRLLINSQIDIPWIASMSNIVGFYERVGLSNEFVANSTTEFYNLAIQLLNDRYVFRFPFLSI